MSDTEFKTVIRKWRKRIKAVEEVEVDTELGEMLADDVLHLLDEFLDDLDDLKASYT